MKTFRWPNQRDQIERFFARANRAEPSVEAAVADVLAAVRQGGDRAVSRLTKKFDHLTLDPSRFEVSHGELKRAWETQPPEVASALRLAARRIEAFHKRQRLRGWAVNETGFGRMEMRVQAVDRVGVYAPGGKAAYPSTVLMDVIPARVAGVKEIILVTPPGRGGAPNAAILAAAHIAGATRVFQIGGAQAIAALAYGTETIPRVDKIVGPGNIYVATAKRMLFGQIGIDSIAGPTEVLILADKSARPDWIAADLIAQAEHDEAASAGVVLIGALEEMESALRAELNRQLKALPRGAIASAAIRKFGYIIHVADEAAAAEIANMKAPEHVQVMTKRPRALAAKVRHAGAIFIGAHTPEPVGDYIAGPNHTLPTGGTARFFSPLSVWTFYKTCHTIEATRAGLARLAPAIESLAEAEGLTGHAESVRIRFRNGKR